MDDREPRLRDGGQTRREPFRINQIPDSVIYSIARQITGLLSFGRRDINGDDWGDIWANAITGKHLARPLGLVDVVSKQVGWSVKTVKTTKKAGAIGADRIRLISGRNSPDYSLGITDLHSDIQKTGEAVLKIWNGRIDLAENEYWPNRTAVLIRSKDMLSYSLFEEPLHRYDVSQYEWRYNAKRNLEAIDRISGKTCFTWQFHGSQFTVHSRVPNSARRFRIMNPPPVSIETALDDMDYSSDWTTILPNNN